MTRIRVDQYTTQPMYPQAPQPSGPFAGFGLFGALSMGQSYPKPFGMSGPEMRNEEMPPAALTPSQFDLDGVDLEALRSQVFLQFNRASEERRALVEEADRDERSYNQEKYNGTQLPFSDALSVRIPAARSRVDKVSAEIGAAFDRDGSPVFGATPLTPSMAGLKDHVESFFHQLLTSADATNQYRVGINRAFKTGTSFLVSEVISRKISGMASGQNMPGQEDQYENALVIRSVKMQDMYILPVGVTDMKDAGFVGERFQMPRWTFNDYLATGFYAQPLDDVGQPVEIVNGLADQTHGMSEEFKRLMISGHDHSDKDPAGLVDLTRAYVRFQRPSEVGREGGAMSRLYYVVFPTKNPRLLLRAKENPYSLLDQSPYVPMPAGMGDGTIWGEGWIKLLRSLTHLLDTLHMLHIEAQKRAYGRFYLVREDSGIDLTLKSRAAKKDIILSESATLNPPQKLTRIMPDEIFSTDDPTADLKDFSMADMNPGFVYDENRIIQYMNAATIDDMPMAGSVRTAFELRGAASQTAAKLKALLKTFSSKCLKPHIEIVKAQVWEYMMEPSILTDRVRHMEYGDITIPITMTDFFTGVSLDPAGTTTSADETVAISTTASLIQELVPIIMNVPGIVADPATAIRELLKERTAALGFQKFLTLFGLTPPTEQEVQKSTMYLMLAKQIASGGQGGQGDPMAQMMPTMMGADGGAVQGAPSMNMQMTPGTLGDQQGGAANGLAPQIAQAMGAPRGANA